MDSVVQVTAEAGAAAERRPPDGIIVTDESGVVLEFTPACERIFGYRADEVVGCNVSVLVPPAEARGQDGGVATYLGTRNAPVLDVGRELTGRRRSGELFPLRLSLSESRRDGRRVFVGIVGDITARKAAYAELHRSLRATQAREARMRAVLETAVDGIIVIDEAGTVLEFNPACERMFGYDAKAVVGRNVSMLMPTPHAEQHDSYLEAYHRTGERKIIGIGRQVEGKRNSGEVFPMDLSVGRSEETDAPVFVGIVRDVTAREHAQAELLRRQRALAQSNRDLEQFAYVASHDLKSPLRGIMNITSWLAEELREVLTAEQAELFALMRGRVGRMEALLDDILTYSRAGRAEGAVQTVDASVLVAEITEDLALGGRFAVRIDAPLPTIAAQRGMLRQVFANLLSNAVAHHDREVGTIAIAAERRDGFYRFRVTDDGPGIDPRYRDRVFKLFETLRRHDEAAGSGLGLAIVKKLVERNGGTVAIEDNPEGRGTSVRFDWPDTPPQAEEEPS